MRPLGGNSSKLNISTTSSASGIWSTSDQFLLKKNGIWPNSLGLGYCAEYLAIGGGGSGNQGYINDVTSQGGGGGGGGFLSGNVCLSIGSSLSIVVGAGGSFVAYIQEAAAKGSNTCISTCATAYGGGGGGMQSRDATPGASGGGGSGSYGWSNGGTALYPGQGCNGSPGSGAGSGPGGGGGGAGGAGGVPTAGPGRSHPITGTPVTYAAGGAGGVSGGSGSSGPSNSGNGGGGSGNQNTAGSGGSGVVILRYLGPQRGTGGNVTSSGGFTIHTFNSSGTYTV